MKRPLRHFLTLLLAATVLLCALVPAAHADSLRRPLYKGFINRHLAKKGK